MPLEFPSLPSFFSLSLSIPPCLSLFFLYTVDFFPTQSFHSPRSTSHPKLSLRFSAPQCEIHSQVYTHNSTSTAFFPLLTELYLPVLLLLWFWHRLLCVVKFFFYVNSAYTLSASVQEEFHFLECRDSVFVCLLVVVVFFFLTHGSSRASRGTMSEFVWR